MDIFPRRLKAARERRDLTQRELALMVKLAPSTIALYETGDRRPDPDTLRRLADALNCSTDYLLGRADDPRPLEADETTYDPDLPPDWLREVEFIRRAGTKLSPEERNAFIELAKLFVKRVEAEERERSRREEQRKDQ